MWVKIFFRTSKVLWTIVCFDNMFKPFAEIKVGIT